ncbi:hypothetical protein PR202_gb05368 [Eleusine coracana subsp. coracana]|uniref:AB hydrolase-1 domain-containing protein n=1 Tax=Eleusine coracana subsp. coracana TaxID=191504 RepID=A0AAV5E667_ELECO|nr:hypothetical protein PR202_gb05368 [Eleusine coracana subsp. coracana]
MDCAAAGVVVVVMGSTSFCVAGGRHGSQDEFFSRDTRFWETTRTDLQEQIFAQIVICLHRPPAIAGTRGVRVFRAPKTAEITEGVGERWRRVGKGWAVERASRAVKTVWFVVALLASLLVASAPALVAAGDVSVALWLEVRLGCLRCHGLRDHLQRYSFRSSLADIPLVSIVRSLVITCVYIMSDTSGLSHGPYLGTTTFCSLASLLILIIKASVYSPVHDIGPELSPSLADHKQNLKKLWGMPVLFLSSLVFALGHVIVAYRTSCQARRKLLIHHIDSESILAYKNAFSGSYKGITVHYKISGPSTFLSSAPDSFMERDTHDNVVSSRLSPRRQRHESPPSASSNTRRLLNRSFSHQYHHTSLYAPLLVEPVTSATLSDEVPLMSLDDDCADECLNSVGFDLEAGEQGKFAIVLVHGFGGGVFSWRHVSNLLARQVGCTVLSFDRPGWGLTSRPRRKDWEDKKLANPYEMESQVDLLISFCSEMGLRSVVLVGHDDGGLLALKTAEKLRTCGGHRKVEVKGVVLIGAPLFVEGWDEALHEVGRLSFSMVLSSKRAADLLRSVEGLPVLVVAGSEDALVSAKVSASYGFKTCKFCAAAHACSVESDVAVHVVL